MTFLLKSITRETANPKIFLGWTGFWVASLFLPKPKTDLFNLWYTPSATQKQRKQKNQADLNL